MELSVLKKHAQATEVTSEHFHSRRNWGQEKVAEVRLGCLVWKMSGSSWLANGRNRSVLVSTLETSIESLVRVLIGNVYD